MWLRRLVLLGAACVALAAVVFAVAYARTDIPNPNKGFQAQTTYVYYADGETVLGRFAEQNRTSVELSEVPRHVQDAVVAAEDRSFWTNKGIDPKGILRAAFNNATGGSTQGASTITQQYVKVFYLSQDRTWSRKAKEAILSLKIQRQMDKEEILAGYLNTIYFGRSAYGIEAAARAYFAKPARELSVQEGAALAAVINSPNNYDPADGRAARRALKARYTYVLDSMTEMGTLPPRLVGTRKVYRLPAFPQIKAESQYGGQRGHLLRMVRQELNTLGYRDSEIDAGGLRIRTTFTKKAMDAAAAAVEEQRPDLDGLHVAVASVEPGTGALRGLYAGQDYLVSQLNWAVAGGAPGSTFKPFALATALSNGYSLESTFDGSSPLEVGGTEFSNQGEGEGRSYGTVSLLTATESSVNTAYVEMVDSIPDGPAKVRRMAVDMGIPTDAPGFEPNLSMVLGSATVSPIDMANAYATIAAGGTAAKAHVVESIASSAGDEVYRHRGRTTQPLTPEVAADTTYALQEVVEDGTGGNAALPERPVAGKTGTATDDAGRVRSSWFVGYTPQLSTAVMYSRGNGNEPLDGFLPTFYGGEYPARTWAATTSRALEGVEAVDFPEPAFIDQTVEGHEPTPTYVPEPPPTRTPEPPAPEPTQEPSEEPTPEPTPEPTAPPTTPEPTQEPTTPPTQQPTQQPTPPPASGGPTSRPDQDPAGTG